jgi:hypothetical protein
MMRVARCGARVEIRALTALGCVDVAAPPLDVRCGGDSQRSHAGLLRFRRSAAWRGRAEIPAVDTLGDVDVAAPPLDVHPAEIPSVYTLGYLDFAAPGLDFDTGLASSQAP